MRASPNQIAALSKVFAPHYSRWKTWAEQSLSMSDASPMIARVIGMTQNDLNSHAQRHAETVQAFEEVREMARKLGYEYHGA